MTEAAPPPDPFPADFNTRRLPAGLELWRIHDPRFSGDEFNPCRGAPSRFAPLHDASGACVPTLYAAETFEAAVHESIFHDVPYDAPRKFVRRSQVVSLAVSRLRLRSDLTLAPLNEPDLAKLRSSRDQLIHTPPTSYSTTVLWARAFHASGRVAGLVWTSRRADPSQALVLFGDRTAATALEVVDRRALALEPGLVREIRGFGRRAGITISL